MKTRTDFYTDYAEICGIIEKNKINGIKTGPILLGLQKRIKKALKIN